MASRHDHSKALRVIAHELVKRRIDIFELRCLRTEYYLQCGDPTPPHVGLIELTFSDDDVVILDVRGAGQRGDAFKLVDFEALPEVFRAIGRYVQNKEADLLRICNAESPLDGTTLRLEYETRDGINHVDHLGIIDLAEIARRMYKERSRASAERAVHH